MTMDALRAYIEAKVGAPLDRSAILFDGRSNVLRHTGEVAGLPVVNSTTVDKDAARTLLRSFVPDVPAEYDYISATVFWDERRATITIYANGTRTSQEKRF